MSGNEENKTTPTVGPRRLTRLDLMGVRFANEPENAEPGNGGAGTGAGGSEYKAPETQADLDRIISARLSRDRENFKDFDTFKAKAQQFDELQRSNAAGTPAKPADPNDATTQRLNELATNLDTVQRTSEETSLKLLRAEVALDKSIGKDDLVLLTGTTREELEAQAERITKLAGAANSGSGRVPGQGGRENNGSATSVAAGRDLFTNSRSKKTSTS